MCYLFRIGQSVSLVCFRVYKKIRLRKFSVPNISILDSYELGNDYVDFVSPESCQAHVGSSVNFCYK